MQQPRHWRGLPDVDLGAKQPQRLHLLAMADTFITALAWPEEESSHLSQRKTGEVLWLMCGIVAKVLSHSTMPSRIVFNFLI